jgi:hypothetical protein
MHKALLWPHEVGAAIGLSAKTINRMADAGVVEAIRDVRGRRRFRPEVVDLLRAKLGLIEEGNAGAEADPGHAAHTH